MERVDQIFDKLQIGKSDRLSFSKISVNAVNLKWFYPAVIFRSMKDTIILQIFKGFWIRSISRRKRKLSQSAKL